MEKQKVWTIIKLWITSCLPFRLELNKNQCLAPFIQRSHQQCKVKKKGINFANGAFFSSNFVIESHLNVMRLWTMAVMKNVIKFLISTWLMSVSCSFSVPLFFSFFAFSEFLRFFRLRFLRLCAQCILCTLTLMSFVCYLQRLFDACFRSSFIFSVVSVSNTPYFSRLWFSHTLPTPSLISFFIFSFSFCVFIVYIFLSSFSAAAAVAAV